MSDWCLMPCYNFSAIVYHGREQVTFQWDDADDDECPLYHYADINFFFLQVHLDNSLSCCSTQDTLSRFWVNQSFALTPKCSVPREEVNTNFI